MGRRVLTMVLIMVMSLLIPLLASPMPVAAGSWGPWSCQWAVSGYPVSGGTLDGRGCAQWWQTTVGTENWWQAWGDTWAPAGSYAIQTYAAGYDSCSGGSFVYRMSASNTVYNTDYGTSGSPAFGSYDNACTNNHRYAVYYVGQRQATSSSSWEGTGAWVYF